MIRGDQPQSRAHAELGLWIALQAAGSWLLWWSGSGYGSYSLECQVGEIAADAARWGNAAFSLSDYFDNWTASYLFAGLLAAPFHGLGLPLGVAVKLGASVVAAGVLAGVWWLCASAGRRAQRLAVAALVWAPPLLGYHRELAGNYHYAELLWELAGVALTADLLLHRRAMTRWFGCGLGFGLAVATSPAALPYAFIALACLTRHGRAPLGRSRRAGLLAGLSGGVVGLAPVLSKVLFHRPYGLPSQVAPGGLPGLAPPASVLSRALFLLPRDLPANLGFAEPLHVPLGPAAARGLGTLWVALTATACGLLLWRRRGGLRAGGAALVRLLPALCALGMVGAYLAADEFLPVVPLHRSQLRQARFLPPLIAWLAVSLGMAAGEAGRVGPALRRVGWLAPLAGLLCLPFSLDAAGLRGSRGVPYRARCSLPSGFFLGAHLPPADPRGPDWCGATADPAACRRGFAWRTGIRQAEGLLDEEGLTLAPLDPAHDLCGALPAALRAPCALGFGAVLLESMEAADDRPLLGEFARSCRARLPTESAPWCIRAAGYVFQDHQGYTPWKLRWRLGPLAPGQAERDLPELLRGAGLAVADTIEGPWRQQQLCDRYELIEPGWGAWCREGLALRE